MEIVARVMGDYDEITPIELKELLEPLAKTNEKWGETLSMFGLRFASAMDPLDRRFRLGPRPTIDVADDRVLYEVLLQDAITWNWELDRDGPTIFWTLRLKQHEAATLRTRSQLYFVKQADGSQLLSRDFSPPRLQRLGESSRESILATDKVNPIKTQAMVQMRACYERLVTDIGSRRIDLESVQTIGSFLSPVRTSKIEVLRSSNRDVERLTILYYSVAIFLDQIRISLGDPRFDKKKMGEHLVRLKELADRSNDYASKSWSEKFLKYHEKILTSDRPVWPSCTEVDKIDFLDLNEMAAALNNLRMARKAKSSPQDVLATAEIMEIIARNNPGISSAEAWGRYGAMIEIWCVLKRGKPETIEMLADAVGVRERTAWKHVKKLREWGAIPPDQYTHLARSKRKE